MVHGHWSVEHGAGVKSKVLPVDTELDPVLDGSVLTLAHPVDVPNLHNIV